MARGLQVWSQTAASNATADTGINWAESMAPSAVNDSARAEMASMAKWRDDNNGSIVGTLSTATYSVTSSQVAGALTAGYTIAFQIGSAMPATALLNLDTLGAKPLRPAAGVDFIGGEYPANTVINAAYFSSNSGEWIITGGTTSLVPAGAVISFAGSSAPTGWLLCNGASVLRATYVALFAAIGTTYGAADGSHFTLPDATGRTIAGKEASATRLTSAVGGVDGGTLGATGGSESHALTIGELASHTHTGTTGIEDAVHTHAQNSNTMINGGVAANFAGGGNVFGIGGTTGNQSANHHHAFTSDSTGSGTAHANVQPTIVLNFIIKT